MKLSIGEITERNRLEMANNAIEASRKPYTPKRKAIRSTVKKVAGNME